MTDRRIMCANCDEHRADHYLDDGSWDPDQDCTEYEGRSPTTDEIRMYRDMGYEMPEPIAKKKATLSS